MKLRLKSFGARLPAEYLLAIAWVNICICRELLFTTHTSYTNSMHRLWMVLAPLVPDLTGACAKIAGSSRLLRGFPR